MPLEGGKRERMIWMSVWSMISDNLDALGWLTDPVAAGYDRAPVTIPWGGFPDGEPITPNGIAVMPEDVTYTGLETGSTASQRNRVFYADIFAEDHAVGINLRGDISSILRGEYPSIGRDRNIVEIYDFDLATPAVVAVMDIENVSDDRSKGGTEPWERYWYSVLFTVEDEGWDD